MSEAIATATTEFVASVHGVGGMTWTYATEAEAISGAAWLAEQFGLREEAFVIRAR